MDLQHVEAQLGAWAHHHASMGESILHAVSFEHLPKHSLHPLSSMDLWINYLYTITVSCLPLTCFPISLTLDLA